MNNSAKPSVEPEPEKHPSESQSNDRNPDDEGPNMDSTHEEYHDAGVPPQTPNRVRFKDELDGNNRTKDEGRIIDFDAYMEFLARTKLHFDSENQPVSEEEVPQDEDEVKVLLHRTAESLGAVAERPSRDYSYGNIPINYEMDLKSKTDAAVADGFLASIRLLQGEDMEFTEQLHKTLSKAALAARISSQHHKRVSDELRRAHNPPTLARKPKIGTKDFPPNIKPGYFIKYTGDDDQNTFTYLNWVDQIFSYLEGYTSRVHLDV